MELEQEASTAPTAAEEMVVEEPPVEVEPHRRPRVSGCGCVSVYSWPDEINDCLKQIVLKKLCTCAWLPRTGAGV